MVAAPSGDAAAFADLECAAGFDPALPTACQCAPGCVTQTFGPRGRVSGVDPANTLDGVDLDPESGDLVLQATRSERSLIWIANTAQGTVSKVDTRTLREEGRYAMGPSARTDADSEPLCPPWPYSDIETLSQTCEDPSRTSVNGDGDVFVGLRAAGAVVKLAAGESVGAEGSASAGVACPDTNVDGRITTSSGRNDILPFGDDDCLLWRRELLRPRQGSAGEVRARQIRAVAAQDLENPQTLERIPYVWVGDDEQGGVVWKLDGRTGEVLMRLETPPAAPYGMALGGDGNLWISGRSNGTFGRINTRACTPQRCPASSMESINILGFLEFSADRSELLTSTYGITVDFKGRVWLATGRALLRYDPNKSESYAHVEGSMAYACTGPRSECTELRAGAALDNYRWVSIGAPGAGQLFRGVTADSQGYVFAALQGGNVVRYEGDTPRNQRILPGTNLDGASWGMATDADGQIWTIGFGQPHPRVFDVEGVLRPEAGDIELTLPYTYSDMTGSQLRFATQPAGTLRRTFEGCSAEETTRWHAIGLATATPPRTRITVRARSASTPEGLAAAAFVAVGEVPGNATPLSLTDALQRAEMQSERYLEVELRLITDNQSGEQLITPRLLAADVGYFCATPTSGLI